MEQGLIEVSHHQFWLLDTGLLPGRPADFTNGLIAPAGPGAAMICTGIHSGRAALAIEPRRAAPPGVDLNGWDEIVEITLSAPTGQLRPAALMAGPADALFAALTMTGPGSYRIRVHARGRDTLVDGVSRDPVEEYRITAWPGPLEPGRIYRQTDTYGATVRKWGPRRDRA